MGGLLRAVDWQRTPGRTPMADARCRCGWHSGPQSSKVKAVALHDRHVADECPIGRR